MARLRGWPTLGLVALLLAGGATQAHARADEAMLAEFKAGFPELFPPQGDGRVQPMAVPDIFGTGAVLNVGNVYMKVTNFDVIGNPFTNLSTDPSGQWPGASGVEYLSFILVAVGGVNKTATDPAAVRRVSQQPEWRPQTLEPQDRMYKSFDGQVSGQRLFDDDGDAAKSEVLDLDRSLFVDEDFQDGRDNDGDGLIDEDYGAIGQQMWSCTIWDNTAQALAATLNEKHVPLNLEMRQTAWAYSVPGFQDFNAINWTIFNRSGHAIDSMYVGIRWDMDAGPPDNPVYFNDDADIPFFPHGDFTVVLSGDDKWGAKMDPKTYRRQRFHADMASVPSDSSLCPRVVVRVNGFSVVDIDGDEGRTKGIASILLLGHTTDPLGLMAPARVGWSQFRSHAFGTPYAAGGVPVVDAQRAELLQSKEGIDPETGFINATPVDIEGDIQGWASVGPFGNTDQQGVAHPIPDGGSIEVTIAFAVQRGDLVTVNEFPADYQTYLEGRMSPNDLFSKYPALENAFAAQVGYEGVYEGPPAVLADTDNINTPDFHGAETRVRAPRGFILYDSDCRDEGSRRQIDEYGYTWFDFDCDFCTGVWEFGSGTVGRDGLTGSGKMLKRWSTAAPPPNPGLNASAGYNFSDNPERRVAPGQNQAILLAWDNLSEITVDPEKTEFDFRSYRLWKVSNWRRPVGASGPADDDWTLLAHFRFFDYADSNKGLFSDSLMVARGFWPSAFDSVHAGQPVCPQVYIPNLSLQTVVLQKSRFSSSSVAADWVRTHGYRYENNLSEDATTWRFRQADGECRYNSLHTVGLEDSTVLAEVCLNALAETRGFRVPICLYKGDLWDLQSGEVVRPLPDHCPRRAADGTCLVDTLACVKDDNGDCRQERGKVVGTNDTFIYRTKYPVGRYQYLDREVKNGFIYFYSLTAGDSTATELTGRRSGVEAEGVYPQAATRPVGQTWVVPNPYRGYSEIGRRPSAWDLTPNATDPTGTHLDFMGLPAGRWTIRIFTVSGDLVQVLRSEDAVNESVRGPATVRNPNYKPNLAEHPIENPKTITLPGYNRQADTPNDGQARWNLISRNGQDVVSGVYMFVVESDQGTQRGKFVVIR
ncbi:MAG: hypothetical protein AAB290_02915 [Candidatus Eisenbacteria bacterium]